MSKFWLHTSCPSTKFCVEIDVKFLGELSEKASKDLEKLTQEIYRESGAEFNIKSPKQLSDILFVQMKLPVIKKTKTG